MTDHPQPPEDEQVPNVDLDLKVAIVNVVSRKVGEIDGDLLNAVKEGIRQDPNQRCRAFIEQTTELLARLVSQTSPVIALLTDPALLRQIERKDYERITTELDELALFLKYQADVVGQISSLSKPLHALAQRFHEVLNVNNTGTSLSEFRRLADVPPGAPAPDPIP